MEVVSVTNLKKKYGEFLAVDHISFSIKQGEVFGFLGPNGAGKTSTINMMIGLSRPTGGHIEIFGIDAVKDVKKVQRIIGVVPDENNLYDEMNGFDNLCFCASLYGISKAKREKRAVELLEQFNLTDAGKRPFKTYSKGMKRKLTIAAAIIHDPKILFLDEPTTGIDVESARQIRELILHLKNQGKTIFITTHYIEEAQRVCDRIAFIVKGRIVKIGSVRELLENTEQEHKLKLKVAGSLNELSGELKNHFQNFKLEILDENSLLITSEERVTLSPIIRWLDSKGILVYEAREIKPSLEDVFVKITGSKAAQISGKEKVEM
ncbi:MAG TPA: ABC transporter ATP-binding protein [Thermoanaerobacterales bacterium]|uniref:ABC transporter ATP-binding protein n=1 Tax=Tepidanaerobacter sp. GT38 TaxID=2722793 RepID=UPI0017FFF5A9|nr:ABC transporter ATP-binding protein [Tepidanaerobacter sp. GT38]MCG1013185.1 ABC transporter ATP-binding protein [Tepidanaerobacter sp. GT38]HHY41371.1 ABC transporter ATP-binding protein [Thermoanaerobacterales bacterium]